jgi:hypothetical protein
MKGAVSAAHQIRDTFMGDVSSGATEGAYHTGISNDFRGGIATTMMQPHAHNPIFSDYRIATTKGYRGVSNSVIEVPFEVSQNLAQAIPLKQQIDAGYLQALIKREPRCTLLQLCNWVQEECGITISQTAMCRLIKGYNLHRKRSHRRQLDTLPLAA